MKYQILHYRHSLDDLLADIAEDLCKSKKEFRKKVEHEVNLFHDERIWIFESMDGDDCGVANCEEMNLKNLCQVFMNKFDGLLEICKGDDLSKDRPVEENPKVYFAIYGY